jgi:hypothetical protein
MNVLDSAALSVGPILNESSFTVLNEPFGLVYAVYVAPAAKSLVNANESVV